MRSFGLHLFVAFATGLSLALPAQAQDWTFSVTPYAWMAGLDGKTRVAPSAPEADVDLSFGDILDQLDYAGFLFFNARNGPWVIRLDTSSVKTSDEEKIGGPDVNTLELRTTTTTLALSAGRVVVFGPNGELAVHAGARAWWLDNKLVVGKTGGGKDKYSSDADWIDPIIGISGAHRFNRSWSAFGMLEVGGFGIGADSEWGFMATANYAFSESISVNIGYRHLAVDYREDGIVYDTAQSGPVLGLTFRF